MKLKFDACVFLKTFALAKIWFMSAKHQVDFIGAGNVAWNLAPALENIGVAVRNVYSHNPKNAKKLAKRLYEGQVKEDLDFSDSSASIFIISVTDDAIEKVVREIVLPDDAILAHTSGSIPLSVLGYAATPNIGVFYPLQTFTKTHLTDFDSVPILVEGGNKFTTQTLGQIGTLLSRNVQEVSSTQRQQIHVAAVFACNFTNWMLSQSQELMEKAGLDFKLLQPLIAQTINNSLEIGPENSQTGPAKRGDLEVLDKHMGMLERNPDAQELYRLISQQILDFYNS